LPARTPAPLLDVSFMGLRHRSETFESSAEVLQLAAFTNATHKSVPVDRDDGLQQACGRLHQRTQDLFRGRKQTLEFGNGGLSLLTFEPG
jgi:hypothetical protein